jgi:hypothetical protein
MTPTLPKPGTQARRILDMLLEANGEWVSKQRFIRELYLTQSGARIFELEQPIAQGGFGWNIEHSPDTDAHGFKSYRIVQKVATLPLL